MGIKHGAPLPFDGARNAHVHAENKGNDDMPKKTAAKDVPDPKEFAKGIANAARAMGDAHVEALLAELQKTGSDDNPEDDDDDGSDVNKPSASAVEKAHAFFGSGSRGPKSPGIVDGVFTLPTMKPGDFRAGKGGRTYGS